MVQIAMLAIRIVLIHHIILSMIVVSAMLAIERRRAIGTAESEDSLLSARMARDPACEVVDGAVNNRPAALAGIVRCDLIDERAWRRRSCALWNSRYCRLLLRKDESADTDRHDSRDDDIAYGFIHTEIVGAL